MLVLICINTVVLAENIKIAVASNFSAPIQELVSEFEKNSEHKVSIALGSSGKFYAQISNGAPFQLFFSADQAKPIALENNGLAVSGSRFTYAIGALALWSAKKGFLTSKSFDFKSDNYKLALANPKLAPYGKAAIEALKSIGMKEASEKNWVMGENIAQTYQFVHSQNADMGFVAVSQIMQNGKMTKGSAWFVSAQSHQPIRQDVILLKHGKGSKTAQAFLDFVRSETAQNMIRSYGYTTPSQIKTSAKSMVQ